MQQKPAWGLDAERDQDHEHQPRNELLRGSDQPAHGTGLCRIGSGDSRSPHGADMHEDLDRSGKEASDLCRGEFRLVRRDDVLDNPNRQVGEDAPDGELLPRFGSELDWIGRSLSDGWMMMYTVRLTY